MKGALSQASLFYPSYYHRDYFMYLAATVTTIAMVLVQEDDLGDEHPIYYLSRNLTNTEKLAFAAVQVVQIFFHYILLHKTILVSY